MFQEILILFAIAVVIVGLLRRFHLPPILGYLAAGCLVGPAGLHFFETIHDLHFIAEFGVVFLLFTIGLELSIPKLIAMRRKLLSLGGMQVLLCALLTFSIAYYVGLSGAAAFTIAGALTLSSTAIATKLLIEQDELHRRHGRFALSILLFQDLAAIPFLVLVPALAGNQEQTISQALLHAGMNGALVITLILLLGRWLLRPIFHQVASARSTELFMLTTLLVVLFSAWLTEFFGLSLAFGGFLAGVILAETEYAHQIESDIQPFRDIFLGLFFVTVGMLLDPWVLVHEWTWILLIVSSLILSKTIIIALLARSMGAKAKTAIKTGLVLAQGGEFGFALLTLAFDQNILTPRANNIAIASIVTSMIIAPFLIRHNRKIARWLFAQPLEVEAEENCAEMPVLGEAAKDHVIVCGYGRVGQTLTKFLVAEGYQYIGLDLDPLRLQEASAIQEPVYYGDASEISVLERAGVEKARLLVICFDDHTRALRTISAVRDHGYTLPILVRTRDDTFLDQLQSAGATEVIPEIIEASVMLASHMLVMLGEPLDKVSSQVKELQKDRYRLLRGYYASDNVAHLEDAQNDAETLHAVELTEDAWAVGKNTRTMADAGFNFTVAAFCRDGFKSPSPSEDTIFKPGDVLVIQGPKHLQYQVQEKLLRG